MAACARRIILIFLAHGVTCGAPARHRMAAAASRKRHLFAPWHAARRLAAAMPSASEKARDGICRAAAQRVRDNAQRRRRAARRHGGAYLAW